jgi:hypothetical protein
MSSKQTEEKVQTRKEKPFTQMLGRFRNTARIFSVYGRSLVELLFACVILVLIIIAGTAAYRNVAQHGWNADAAAWAQAAGSIIAIAGAAWLARSEARQARRWRREQGEEAAWGVRFILSQAQHDAQIIAAEITDENTLINDSKILSWRQRSANASLIIGTMLTRLDHIHPAVTVTMCNAKILVDQLSMDLSRMQEVVTSNKKIDEQLISDIVWVHINLNTLIEQYDSRFRSVRKALDLGGDMLPVKDWANK